MPAIKLRVFKFWQIKLNIYEISTLGEDAEKYSAQNLNSRSGDFFNGGHVVHLNTHNPSILIVRFCFEKKTLHGLCCFIHLFNPVCFYFNFGFVLKKNCAFFGFFSLI
jgi:hypothetical protein